MRPGASTPTRPRTRRRAPRRFPHFLARAEFLALALLLLAILALLAVYARPLSDTVVVGGPDDRAATVDFFAPERNPAGLPYRWTGARSTLIFHAAGLAFPANRRLALELPLAASRPPGVPPPRVTIAVNGRDAGQWPVSGQETVRVPIPTTPRDPVDTAATVSTTTFTPAGDRRALGVAVLGPTSLRELSGAGIALPPLGAWLRWLAIVAFATLAALGLTRRPVSALAAGLAAVASLTLFASLDRPLFWQLAHLPLLALALALPLVWRDRLANWTVTLLAGPGGLPRPFVLPAGLFLLVAGQVLLATRALPVLGLVLLLAGLLAAGAALALDASTDDPQSKSVRRSLALPLLGLILTVAAIARFYRLPDVPFGLWRDEARHGLEALHILRDPTYRPVYVPNISLPGLYPLALAADFRLFGASVATLRGFTAAAGVASAAALFLLARRLFDTRVALVAAFLYAVGSWRVSIDRLAFDTAPTTLCTLLGFYFLVRALDGARAGRRALLAFAASGLALSLAVYGYYPGRFGPVVAALTVLAAAVRANWSLRRHLLVGALVAGGVGLLALTPLGVYAATNPTLFFQRSGQVFIFAPQYLQGQTTLEALERNVVKHLVMFNWRGEPNARHHAPGWPMLDVVTAAAFALGTCLALLDALRGRFAATFTLLWLIVLLAPSIVSVDAPSAVRAQDAAPAAYLLAAVGLVAAWRALVGRWSPDRRWRALPAAPAVLAIAAGLNLWLYFVRMPGDPRVLDKFYVSETRAGYAIAAAHARDPLAVAYLPAPYLRDEVLNFVAWQAPLKELPATGPLPPGPAFIVVPRGENFDQQLAVARRVAAQSGLVEVPGPAPPGGGPPVFVAFTNVGR